MLVWHIIWDNRGAGSLKLWAESSALNTRTNAKRNPKPYPFALSPNELVETATELTGEIYTAKANIDTLLLRLPTIANRPQPSSQLLLEKRTEAGTKSLSSWQIPCLSFEAAPALDFLLALPAYPAYHSAFGNSLRFWVQATRFAVELLGRQNFVPTLREGLVNGVYALTTSWELFLNPEDKEQLRKLAEVMPPVCRSFENGDNFSRQKLLEQFLNQTADAFVRDQLRRVQLPSPKLKANSLNQKWLGALTYANPSFTAPPHELKEFYNGLKGWLAQLRTIEPDAPFRTCFKLEPSNEEAEDKTTWNLSFLLQANDDLSLLVPAEEVWRTRSSTLTFLKRRFENPQERLLSDLGLATRLFPPLEESLKTARPVGMSLDTETAYNFLRQGAPLLEQTGFGVFLPPWWQKTKARLGIKLKLKSPTASGSGLLGRDGVVAFDWQVAVGDQALSPQEFERLSQLKVPLVKVRGQWVELRPQDIEAAIAFFEKQRQGEMNLTEALRIGLGQEELQGGFGVTAVEGEGWIGDLLKQLTGDQKFAEVSPPKGLQGTLRPYQLKGLSWLAFLCRFGLGACLADDMGLGKTIQLIALLLMERENNQTPGPTLLVCPMSIVGNWQRELTKFAPSLKVLVHHGAERSAGEDFKEKVTGQDVVLTTYSLTHRDQEELGGIEWERLVLDEAQNIKNSASRQTQAIRKLPARYRVALTGTPVENRLSELWSIMDFLNPGYLGPASDFNQRFANSIEKYHDKNKAETLKRLIQPFVLRRVKTDKAIIQDLPDKLEMKVFCNLTREQATLYEAVVREMLQQIEEAEGMQRRGLVLATLTRLKQICNHPAHFNQDGSSLPGRSGKLARLTEMLEEVLAEGEKALIFTQFAEMGGMLRPYLQEQFGCETLFLYGGTPKKERDEMVWRFQEERRGPPLFILSLKAGGVGLNLTAANHVFHFDRWWNPAVENQATDRAFRIGQQKKVQVHKFICGGTLEERIDQMIEQKKELAASIVGSGENWITEFSTSQLKELFALSREAIGD